MKPLKDKTVAKTQGRGAGTRNVYPHYVTLGNAKKVDLRLDACDDVPEKYRGQVQLDFDAYGILVGVEISR